ncbi:MAG TPA: hypothetical protein DIC35_04115 [Candidatus Moranbacteria bacterium]|nr:hypothetical protein [Candidatus Moranbacteria bacterium]
MKLSYKNCFIAVFVFAFFSYIPTPFFGLSEIKNTFTALADDTIIISGKVLGPPQKPVVTSKAICADKKLSIRLDWPTDENSESFDIKRNGELLATDIINSDYEDNDVSSGISNIYQVIAHGPMWPGIAASDEIAVFTPTACIIAKPPFTQEIRTLNNVPLEKYGNNPKIEESRPSFSGKTNIPYAKVEISVSGSPQIYQTIFANVNGFWSWQSSETLDLGEHTIIAAAIDPNDSNNSSSSSFTFTVYKEESGNKDKEKDSHTKKSPSSGTPSSIPDEVELLEKSSENPPFQITAIVGNFNHYVFLGEKLSLQVDFSKKTSELEDKDYQIFYEIINARNEVIYVDSQYLNVLRTETLNKKIPISALASIGEYRIRVKAYDGKILIAGENFFSVKELPLVNIGFCTLSLSQIIGSLGWAVIGILLFFLFLLKREYRKTDEEIYQVNEKYLKKDGFFSNKKK